MNKKDYNIIINEIELFLLEYNNYEFIRINLNLDFEIQLEIRLFMNNNINKLMIEYFIEYPFRNIIISKSKLKENNIFIERTKHKIEFYEMIRDFEKNSTFYSLNDYYYFTNYKDFLNYFKNKYLILDKLFDINIFYIEDNKNKRKFNF